MEGARSSEVGDDRPDHLRQPATSGGGKTQQILVQLEESIVSRDPRQEGI